MPGTSSHPLFRPLCLLVGFAVCWIAPWPLFSIEPGKNTVSKNTDFQHQHNGASDWLSLLCPGSPAVLADSPEPEAAPSPAPDASALPRTGDAPVGELAMIDDLIASFVSRHQLPGTAVAITFQGRLVYARGFGYADREEQQPVRPDSLFRIASLSKPITAVAIMQLVEREKIRLDQPVFELLQHEPLLDEEAKPDPRVEQVTILQCLQHTGGWDRSVSYDPMFRPIDIAAALGERPPADPDQVIRYMRGQPLDFDPGERYAYSNFGYCLLGRVIEAVSDQSYEEYVQTAVLRPLGIRRMQIGKTLLDGRAEGEVRYYTRDNLTGAAVIGEKIGDSVPVPYGAWYVEAMDSHGGWIASAVDLVRFAKELDDANRCSYLKPDGIDRMFAPPPKPIGLDENDRPNSYYYGCGWGVRTLDDGQTRQCSHMGMLPGTSTWLMHRSDGINCAVLFNGHETDEGRHAASVVEPLILSVLEQIREWPEHDLFSSNP